MIQTCYSREAQWRVNGRVLSCKLVQYAIERASGTAFNFPGRNTLWNSNSLSCIRQRIMFSFFILLEWRTSYIKDTDCWSVTTVNWRPQSRWSHFRMTWRTAQASFSTLDWCNTHLFKVLENNATGRPSWFRVAEIALSEASVPKTKGNFSSITLKGSWS